jgi:TRAP-type transport system periplasmic protein
MKSRSMTVALVAALLCAAVAVSAQEIQERVLRFGHLNAPDHAHSYGVKRFGELLTAKSGGKLKVQEYPASQLGNDLQQHRMEPGS